MTQTPKAKFAWHISHAELITALWRPITVRRKYIKEMKPHHEIATRLRLLKTVKGELPASVQGPALAYVKLARRVVAEGYVPALGTAQAVYNKAMRKALPEIEKLHAKECHNCPWDGETIFPETPTG